MIPLRLCPGGFPKRHRAQETWKAVPPCRQSIRARLGQKREISKRIGITLGRTGSPIRSSARRQRHWNRPGDRSFGNPSARRMRDGFGRRLLGLSFRVRIRRRHPPGPRVFCGDLPTTAVTVLTAARESPLRYVSNLDRSLWPAGSPNLLVTQSEPAGAPGSLSTSSFSFARSESGSASRQVAVSL